MIGEVLELRKLIKNRKLARDELEALQNRRLRAVIRSAYENVPYYRSLFRSKGLHPDDIRIVEDLKYIPITTKDNLRAAGLGKIMAKDVKVSFCNKTFTSGSTGKPLTIYLNPSEVRTRRLVQFRELLSIGFRPLDRLALLGPEQLHWTRFYQRIGLYRSGNISPFLSMKDQIQSLKRLRPTVLWAYPTMLRALLHKNDYRVTNLDHLRVLITSGEVFDEEIREKIQSDLDIKMFNFYGALEIGRIADECSAQEGLHVNADHVILECLNDGRPVEWGTPGVVVLTTLNVSTMPFIRYRMGDICTLIEKTCSCGSSFPLIGPPRGREESLIRLPSGRVLSPLPFAYILRKIGEIDQFRVIQENYDHFVIQLTFGRNPKDETLSSIRSSIMNFLDEPVRVDIKPVDLIHEEKLKYRAFISKLPQSKW
jgi:phenylacetate-CoA ligase